MKARVLFILIAIALAAVVALAQIDRQSRLSPGYAAMVPAAFSASAARARSKLFLQLGDTQSALAEARNQILLRPMPAESLTILALSTLQSGDAETGRLALEAASRRGWREPIAQLASGQGAFAQGAYDIASQRVVALLSTGNLAGEALALNRQIVALPEGREATARSMARFARWDANALILASDVAEPRDWAATIAMALENGADLSCSNLQRLVTKYRRTGDDDAALTIETASADRC